MRILMFSSDPRAFQPGSSTWDRMQLYGSAVKKLELICMDRTGGRYVRFWNGYQTAKKKLRNEHYDMIVAQDVEHAFLAWRLSRKFNVPFQMQFHTDMFSPYFWSGSFFNKARVLGAQFLVPRASCIRVVSERIKRSLEMRYPHKQLQIVVLPVIPVFTTHPKGTPFQSHVMEDHDFLILMVARLEKEKNVPLALRVFKTFLRERPQALLLVIGTGSQKHVLEQLCIFLGIEKNVIFQNEYTREYEMADVLLLTSNYEGYGLVALEALHHGVPVIMTDVGVAGEVVRDGVNGFIVPVGDEAGLSSALKTYAENPTLQERLYAGARNTPLPYQSPEEYRDKLIQSWKTCTIKNV